MRNLLPVLLCLSMVSFRSQAQTASEGKQFYSSVFDWKINIPAGFDSVPPEIWSKMQGRGKAAIENAIDEKIEGLPETIFVFSSDQFHYFESNYQHYNGTTDGNYEENFKDVGTVLYETFKAQVPTATLDSAFSYEFVDGKRFLTFNFTITIPDKLVMNMLMYSRLFGNKDFTINIVTVDKEKQKLLLDAWRSSTFGKK